jgi:RNA polymerase sigma-70 factor (ECF subfamily)
MSGTIEQQLDQIYRDQWAKVLATTIRRTRDVDLAEDIAQETFLRAMSSWWRDGLPPNPGGWLMTTARNLELDGHRRRQALARKLPLLVVDTDDDSGEGDADMAFRDERLRLIFTCCHPALSMDARVALSLRLVCGLSTADVARLFLVQTATMAARITRAKQKIQAAGIPYRVPEGDALDDRVQDVLAVIYLVYTEGHTAGDGASLRRPELTGLATDLVTVMREMMPDHAEVMGLAAFLMLTEARQDARFDEMGLAVLLEEMDRSRWDPVAIATGIDLVERALQATDRERPRPYSVQAAIAALHAEAPSFAETDWSQVVALYTVLMRVNPAPVNALARALAIGMASGPEVGLAEMDRLAGDRQVASYPMFPAARADLLRRAGRCDEAARAYLDAASVMSNEVMARDFRARAARLSIHVTERQEA